MKNGLFTYILKDALHGVLTALMIASVMVAGCAPREDPVARRARQEVLDRQRYVARNLEFIAPLAREDVVAFALEHNLEMSLQERERAIQDELATRSWLKLLPSLTMNHDYSNRTDYHASKSVNVRSGNQALDYSYSSPLETKSGDIGMVWNVLDFGLSYYMARQEDERVLQSGHAIRRTRQNLAYNVTRAYWRTVVAKKAVDMSRDLIDRLRERQDRLQARLAEKTIPQREGLQARREIMVILNRLGSYEREYQSARTEMAQLMGLTPDKKFELVPADFPAFEEYDHYSANALAKEALLNRPELFREDAEEQITDYSVRMALLRMLPSPSAFLKSEWNDNPLLYTNNWYSMGLKTSWNLLNIPQHVQTRRANKMQKELVQQRRMTLAVGIVTQVHLALVQYYQSAEEALSAGDIMRVQDDLVGVTDSMVREGKANEGDLLTAEIEHFFSTIDYMQKFADFRTRTSQLKNTIGRDPGTIARDLPVRMRSDGEAASDGSAPESLWKVETVSTEGVDKLKSDEANYRELPRVKRHLAREGLGELDDSLGGIAARLSHTRYSVANEAKEKLINAGPEGAAAALEMLNSDSRRARIMAIIVVRETGTAPMVASLLPALSDPDPQIRYHASLALKDAFGQDFGYYHNATEETRKEAIEKWQKYLFEYEQKMSKENTSAASNADDELRAEAPIED